MPIAPLTNAAPPVSFSAFGFDVRFECCSRSHANERWRSLFNNLFASIEPFAYKNRALDGFSVI